MNIVRATYTTAARSGLMLVLITLFVAVCAQDATTQPALPEVVQRFVDAANAGDADALAATFAEAAVFDSVGRIYSGRDAIIEQFLIPEVINLGGRYEVLSVEEGEEGRIVVEFAFQAGSLREHFTYAFLIQKGRIQDVVGRYV